MADVKALVRDTGVIRNFVEASDLLIAHTIGPVGDTAMTIGGNISSAALTIGQSGTDVQIPGTVTMTNATALDVDGDATFGNGDGDVITLGGQSANATVDVIYLGTQGTGAETTDTDITLRVNMGISADRGITFDRTADSDAVLILPDSDDAPGAGATIGMIRVNAAGAFEWYSGATWVAAGSAAGNTLNEAYDAGSTITVDAAGGDMNFLITGAAADKFRIADDGENDYVDFECTVDDQLTMSASLQTWGVTTAGTVLFTSGTTFGVDSTGAITLDSDAAFTAGGSAVTVTADGGVMDLDATGIVSINSSGGAINVGNDAVGQAINIGTAGVRTLTVGNAAATEVQVDAVLVDINAGASGVTIDTAAASNFTVSGAAADLTLGARGATITLNEAGETSLDGAFTASSLVGALNELMDGGAADVWGGTSGEALTQYAAVRGSIAGGTASRIYESDADSTATARRGVVGFVQEAAVGAAVAVNIRSMGETEVSCNTTPAWVMGDDIYLSNVTGEVTNDVSGFAAGDTIQRVGYAADGYLTTVGNRRIFISIGEPTTI